MMNKEPNLALLAIKIPDMDGMELLNRLCRVLSVAVIILVAKDDKNEENTALKRGADNYVRKPFSQ